MGKVCEGAARENGKTSRARVQGIVVAAGPHAGRPHEETSEPKVAAFIWGGKVRPSPTLPFGRWKGAA